MDDAGQSYPFYDAQQGYNYANMPPGYAHMYYPQVYNGFNMVNPSMMAAQGATGQPAAPPAPPGATAVPGAVTSTGSPSEQAAAAAAAAQHYMPYGHPSYFPGMMAPGMSAYDAAAASAAAAAGAKHTSKKDDLQFGTMDERKFKKKEVPVIKKPARPHVRPPKQAPSAWQIYFNEYLAEMRAKNPTERLNVSHVARGAGERYNSLPEHERKRYYEESLRLKAQWEADVQAWLETLSPEDIKLENAYRTQQRKSGKSRKSNLKDPHAPKKPLSAYFLFLRSIRASPEMTKEVFGTESETTKQSVLAATKWRELDEERKQPYLLKAEQDKQRYEEARKQYDNLTSNGNVDAIAAHDEAQRSGKEVARKFAATNAQVQEIIAQGRVPPALTFDVDAEDVQLAAHAAAHKDHGRHGRKLASTKLSELMSTDAK